MPAPIPNCYGLPGGRVFGGKYLGSRKPAEARQKIGALLDAGITVFVDLTTPDDHMVPCDAIVHQDAQSPGAPRQQP